MTLRYNAVEARIAANGKAGIALLKQAGANSEEIRYAEYLAKKLDGRLDRYIDVKWRRGFGTL
jgi:hypothetical protein